jgi:hypothetical protein
MSMVGAWPRTYDDVHTWKFRQKLRAYNFTQSAFEPIAIHGAMSVPRNYEPNTRMKQRGSEHPDL